MIARRIAEPPIPESVEEACDKVHAIASADAVSLEELQGAVEYLLDKVKAARGLHSSIAIARVN